MFRSHDVHGPILDTRSAKGGCRSTRLRICRGVYSGLVTVSLPDRGRPEGASATKGERGADQKPEKLHYRFLMIENMGNNEQCPVPSMPAGFATPRIAQLQAWHIDTAHSDT